MIQRVSSQKTESRKKSQNIHLFYICSLIQQFEVHKKSVCHYPNTGQKDPVSLTPLFECGALMQVTLVKQYITQLQTMKLLWRFPLVKLNDKNRCCRKQFLKTIKGISVHARHL